MADPLRIYGLTVGQVLEGLSLTGEMRDLCLSLIEDLASGVPDRVDLAYAGLCRLAGEQVVIALVLQALIEAHDRRGAPWR